MNVFISCSHCCAAWSPLVQLENSSLYIPALSHTYTHKQPSTPPFPTGSLGWAVDSGEMRKRAHTHTHTHGKQRQRSAIQASVVLCPSKLSISGHFSLLSPPHRPRPTFKGLEYLVLPVAMGTIQMLASD